MRFMRVELEPAGGGLTPLDEALAAAPSIRREAIVSFAVFCDRSGGMLYHLTGSPESPDDRFGDLESVRHWEPFQPREAATGEWYGFAHVEPAGLAVDLLELIHDHGLLVETPIEYANGETIRLTLAGPQPGIQDVFAQLRSLTECEVTSTGPYEPTDGGIFSELTPRQRTVLRTAIEAGYYDVPKRATHEDLAAELGCATSTIDEHLRKAESRIFTAIVR